MLYLTWLTGLLRRRTLVVAGVTVGVAVSVALVATMAGFFAVTRASMTRQAIADVAVDWQVQLAPEANPQQAITELANSRGTRRSRRSDSSIRPASNQRKARRCK